MREALKEKFAYFELQYLGMVRRMHERIQKSEEESSKTQGTRKKKANQQKESSKLKKTKSLNLADTELICSQMFSYKIENERKTIPSNSDLYVEPAGYFEGVYVGEERSESTQPLITKSLPITPKTQQKVMKLAKVDTQNQNF